ncbi:MAG: pseudaminic acid synthase [Ignavibacteriales bacterium]
MNKIIEIKKRMIGQGHPAYIIAEMSANHAMEIDNAIKIIHLAKQSGADCIKIQTYTADTITLDSRKEYFMINGGTWDGYNLHDLYKEAFTPWEWQKRLKEEADKVGIDFFSTPFDLSAVDFLEELGVEFYKIASFELTQVPLIKYVASKGKPIIMSTGMGTLEEIAEAVKAVEAEGNNNLCLLRCSSAYPAVPDDMNLKTIQDMFERFGVPIGLSDHSLGSVGALTAVVLGASVIEKHFCISREIKNPDSTFSMEPHEFKQMVEDIRTAEKAIGKVNYELTESEKGNRIFRQSIWVDKDIKKGETITKENIRVARPGYGLEPKYFEGVLGKRAKQDLEFGMPLNWEMIE